MPILFSSACSQPNNYVTNANDCNDSNALAYNGVSEVCDGSSDNDCDNQIDEGVQNTYYLDNDGDGYEILLPRPVVVY